MDKIGAMLADFATPEVRYTGATSASDDLGGHRTGTLLRVIAPQHTNLTSVKIADFNMAVFATGISWHTNPKLTDLYDADDSATQVGVIFLQGSDLRHTSQIRAVLVRPRTLIDGPGSTVGVRLAQSWHASEQVP
jgi:hypothetical protein